MFELNFSQHYVLPSYHVSLKNVEMWKWDTLNIHVHLDLKDSFLDFKAHFYVVCTAVT